MKSDIIVYAGIDTASTCGAQETLLLVSDASVPETAQSDLTLHTGQDDTDCRGRFDAPQLDTDVNNTEYVQSNLTFMEGKGPNSSQFSMV